jgi:hypothetical protein
MSLLKSFRKAVTNSTAAPGPSTCRVADDANLGMLGQRLIRLSEYTCGRPKETPSVHDCPWTSRIAAVRIIGLGESMLTIEPPDDWRCEPSRMTVMHRYPGLDTCMFGNDALATPHPGDQEKSEHRNIRSTRI